jgi:hypothetical protein
MTISFMGVGEIHLYINKYIGIGTVILYALVSNYNQAMLKKELQQMPTASVYSTGKSILLELSLITLIYVGIIYIGIKLFS